MEAQMIWDLEWKYTHLCENKIKLWPKMISPGKSMLQNEKRRRPRVVPREILITNNWLIRKWSCNYLQGIRGSRRKIGSVQCQDAKGKRGIASESDSAERKQADENVCCISRGKSGGCLGKPCGIWPDTIKCTLSGFPLRGAYSC